MVLYFILYYLFQFEFWDGEQNSVPNMWQIIFSNISVQGGVVHPNINGCFDGSSHVVSLPVYNMKVLNRCFVATVVLVFINWR